MSRFIYWVWEQACLKGYYPKCRVPLKCCHELHLMVNTSLIGFKFPLFSNSLDYCFVLLCHGISGVSVPSIYLYGVCFVYLYQISSYSSSVFSQYVYIAPVYIGLLSIQEHWRFQVSKTVYVCTRCKYYQLFIISRYNQPLSVILWDV